MNTSITIETNVNAPIEKVWEAYTNPEAITKWNAASPDWHCPTAESDLRAGGRFLSRMEARDGSAGFDFSGTYDEVIEQGKIAYTMDDGRKAVVIFTPQGSATHVEVTFDLEAENSAELQRTGWQAILDNFKKYIEVQ